MAESSLGVAPGMGFTDIAKFTYPNYLGRGPFEPREILTSPPHVREQAYFTTNKAKMLKYRLWQGSSVG